MIQSVKWIFNASQGKDGVAITIPPNYETFGAVGKIRIECQDSTSYPSTTIERDIVIAPSFGISTVKVFNSKGYETQKPIEGELVKITWEYIGKYAVYFKVSYVDMTNANNPVITVINPKIFNGGSGSWNVYWTVPDSLFTIDANTGYFLVQAFDSTSNVTPKSSGQSVSMNTVLTKSLLNFVTPSSVSAGAPAKIYWGTDDIPPDAKVVVSLTVDIEKALTGQAVDINTANQTA